MSPQLFASNLISTRSNLTPAYGVEDKDGCKECEKWSFHGVVWNHRRAGCWAWSRKSASTFPLPVVPHQPSKAGPIASVTGTSFALRAADAISRTSASLSGGRSPAIASTSGGVSVPSSRARFATQ